MVRLASIQDWKQRVHGSPLRALGEAGGNPALGEACLPGRLRGPCQDAAGGTVSNTQGHALSSADVKEPARGRIGRFALTGLWILSVLALAHAVAPAAAQSSARSGNAGAASADEPVDVATNLASIIAEREFREQVMERCKSSKKRKPRQPQVFGVPTDLNLYSAVCNASFPLRDCTTMIDFGMMTGVAHTIPEQMVEGPFTAYYPVVDCSVGDEEDSTQLFFDEDTGDLLSLRKRPRIHSTAVISVLRAKYGQPKRYGLVTVAGWGDGTSYRITVPASKGGGFIYFTLVDEVEDDPLGPRGFTWRNERLIAKYVALMRKQVLQEEMRKTENKKL